MTNLAVIGVGVMGETVVAGLLRAGWDGESIVVADQNASRLDEVAERHGVVAAELDTAAAWADAVVVVVKPQDAAAVWSQLAACVRPEAVVVSLCAGLTTSQIEKVLPAGTSVIRVMPNTPAQVGAGMAAISAGSSATSDDVALVTELMSALGRTVVVPEKHQDAVTAVSGSGPAYLFYVVEAMVDAGVLLGLARDVATELAVQTVYGSAKLLAESGERPSVLRERVTSPAGTTAAALRKLEDRGVRAAFMEAMTAARDRSVELAN